jgi:hypothetical protein
MAENAVSVTYPTDFLDSATRTRPTRLAVEPSEPVISFTELHADRVPFSSDEKLPRTLIISDDELLLSYSSKSGYVFVPELVMWMPRQHQSMLTTIRCELRDRSYPHGTGLGRYRGCRGPLCRRYRRQMEFDNAKFTADRLRIKREESAKRDNVTLQTRSKRIYQTQFERLKTANPPLAAVDPLIVFFCFREYVLHEDELPKSHIKRWLSTAKDMRKIQEFLFDEYRFRIK